MTGRDRLAGVVVSLVLGAALGLILASAPPIAGDTAVTDPVWLGIMWFVRPQSIIVVVPPLIHLGLGAGVGVLGMLVRATSPTVVILIAVSVNGAMTLLENADRGGLTGVLWWLLGSAISAALMLIGAMIATRLTTSRRVARRASAGS